MRDNLLKVLQLAIYDRCTPKSNKSFPKFRKGPEIKNKQPENGIDSVLGSLSENPVKISAYINKISVNCKSKTPSLPEKLEILKRWYVEHAGQPY
jgi:hypothetical protein